MREHLLVAGLGLTDHLVQGLFHGFQICQRQFGVDHLDIRKGVDAARHVNHVVVLETAHHMTDGVGLADVGQKLVPQTLAFRSPGHQPGDVHELHAGGDYAAGFYDPRQYIKAVIRKRHDPDVGIDGTEGIVLRRDRRLGKGVEQGGFAHVGQAHDAASESHVLGPDYSEEVRL